VILPFGKYFGREMTSLPDDYLVWLAGGGAYYRNRRSTEIKWKVPTEVWVEARRILEARGYTLKGERWEKD